jgi:hypothetical protein
LEASKIPVEVSQPFCLAMNARSGGISCFMKHFFPAICTNTGYL